MNWEKHIGLLLAAALLAAAGCSKAEFFPDMDLPTTDPQTGSEIRPDTTVRYAVATLRSYRGYRYLRIDAQTAALIWKSDADLSDYSDGTRVMVQYVDVFGYTLPSDFFDGVVLIRWISPVEVGRTDPSGGDGPSDPVDLVDDWITSLEDGFLTLHYSILTTGRVQHGFGLAPGPGPYELIFRHDASGDTEEGSILTEGVVCFPLEGLLPDTGGETVSVTLSYLASDGMEKTLTFDYGTWK